MKYPDKREWFDNQVILKRQHIAQVLFNDANYSSETSNARAVAKLAGELCELAAARKEYYDIIKAMHISMPVNEIIQEEDASK